MDGGLGCTLGPLTLVSFNVGWTFLEMNNMSHTFINSANTLTRIILTHAALLSSGELRDT